MAKVILICGKICSGKSTYAVRLRQQGRAVLLSVDEVMLALFGQHAGDMHDTYAARTQDYLLHKSLELVRMGTDVILDWGFWTREGRRSARAFYEKRGIGCELRYLDISEESWRARIEKRNAAVLNGQAEAYFIDDNLAAKFAARFEPPGPEEIDVWIRE